MNTQDTPIDLSLTDWNGRETYQRNTANCYIVRNEGTYQIPLVYGNAIKDNQINTESFYTAGIATDFQDSYGVPFNAGSSPFIRDHASAQGKMIASADLLWNDGMSKINNLSVDENFLTFDVKSFSPCNALIAIKDNDGTILWSWHLWLTDTDLTPKIITNADGVDFKIMPCNLGWNGRTADGEPTSPYYQWGRKDPFIATVDPHVTGENETTQLYYYDAQLSPIKQSFAHKNPNTIIFKDTSNSWTEEMYYYFWDSMMSEADVDQDVTKTIYDPCPAGWNVPQLNAFTGLDIATYDLIGKGATFPDKTNTTEILFPFAGYRNSSGIRQSVNSEGSCWLASPGSGAWGNFFIYSKSMIDPNSKNCRADGRSVRPILTE